MDDYHYERFDLPEGWMTEDRWQGLLAVWPLMALIKSASELKKPIPGVTAPTKN